MAVKDSLWDQIREETAGDFAFMTLTEQEKPRSECYFVTGDALGGGEHGGDLLEDFFQTMVNERYVPQSVILMDRAALFLVKSHRLYPVFMALEESGTAVFASAESLRRYGGEKDVEPIFAAETRRILEILRAADKVITL